MINKELIIKKINEINEFLTLLKNYENLSLNEFLNDRDIIDATKYRLINTIEACMNICSHIVIKKYNIIPENYGECFKILSEKKIINKNLSEDLIKMVRFRNLLIHLYSKVEDKEVFRILKESLFDIEEFVNAIKIIL